MRFEMKLIAEYTRMSTIADCHMRRVIVGVIRMSIGHDTDTRGCNGPT